MSIYSKDYQEHLNKQAKVNNLYEHALEEFSNYTLFGEIPSNSKELAVLLYFLLKDYELYHERL